MVDLSIVILNYKTINLVRQQLRFLFAQHFPFSWEVIVVDNASGGARSRPPRHDRRSDPLEALKKDFPRTNAVALDHNRGMGAGNNAGIAATKGEAVLILNPDVVIMPGAIEQMLEFLRTHERVGMLGPQLKNPDGTLQYSCFRFHRFLTPLVRRTKFSLFAFGRRELARFLLKDHDHSQTMAVDWLLGAAILIRRTALEDAGVFDERFFLFLEDTDLCRRFWQRGWEVVYFPSATMIHYPHRLSSSDDWLSFFRRVTWIHVISWIKYLWKWRNESQKSKVKSQK